MVSRSSDDGAEATAIRERFVEGVRAREVRVGRVEVWIGGKGEGSWVWMGEGGKSAARPRGMMGPRCRRRGKG